MAENNFAFTITAVDRATKVVNNVNKSVNKLFRPFEGAGKSIKSFSDALGRNDLVKRPLWALDKVGKGVTMFGNAFGVAENSVLGGSARIAASLGAIGGPVGGFLAAGAAIIGGSTAVSVAMAKMGFGIDRTAKNLNIGTTELQEYRGAAKLAGLQTEAMDNSLLSLGTTLQEADFGRNPMVAEAMRRMGLSISRTKDGAIDTVKSLRDISDVVSHMTDQNMARKLTDMLGITELLPLLREGTAKIDDYRAQVRRLGGVMDEVTIKKNKEQADAWNQTKTAMDGAAVSVGNLIAKYGFLNEATALTTKGAEALSKILQKKEADEAAGNAHPVWNAITNAIPRYMDPFRVLKMVPYLGRNGAAPEGPRSASGKVMDDTASAGSGPLGLRQNNPGNLRSWQGAGSAGGFASFSTPQAGLSAMGKNLMAYQDKYGINTVSGIVNRWAPPGDHNNTPAYIASVAKQTGFGADQALDLHDPKVLAPLISAITKQENGSNPYSPEVIAQAVASALRDSPQGAGGEQPIHLVVHNVPAGMTVKATRGLGQATVGLTMAPGGAS